MLYWAHTTRVVLLGLGAVVTSTVPADAAFTNLASQDDSEPHLALASREGETRTRSIQTRAVHAKSHTTELESRSDRFNSLSFLDIAPLADTQTSVAPAWLWHDSNSLSGVAAPFASTFSAAPQRTAVSIPLPAIGIVQLIVFATGAALFGKRLAGVRR